MQSLTGNSFRIYSLSERAVTVEFGDRIDEQVLQQVNELNAKIQEHPFKGLWSTVPAYATLSIFFDSLILLKETEISGADCFEKISNYIKDLDSRSIPGSKQTAATITIPVYYGGIHGPDLDELAQLTGLQADEVIRLHSEAVYTVHMIGFVPGFAYLGGMANVLAAPRKATPRQTIPAGSVGIAGQQTGIYPLQTPGGWQIIGRTPLTMFDAARAQPALLKAGDRVIFKPINVEEFEMEAAK